MHNVLFLNLIFLSSVLLAGCHSVTIQRAEGGEPLPVTVRVDDVAYWLEEWQRLINLPEDKLQLALKTRQKEFSASDNVRTRLRLALLLAAGPASVRDQAQASILLKDIDISNSDGSAKALAVLLEQMIAEQQWSSDKIAELRVQLKEKEDRVGELERQLQELKDIEQTIQKRN